MAHIVTSRVLTPADLEDGRIAFEFENFDPTELNDEDFAYANSAHIGCAGFYLRTPPGYHDRPNTMDDVFRNIRDCVENQAEGEVSEFVILLYPERWLYVRVGDPIE